MLRALFRQVQLLPQLLTVTPHLGLQLLLGLQVKLFTPLCRLQLFQGVAPRCVESRLLVLLVRVPATVADIVFGAVVIASVVIAPAACGAGCAWIWTSKKRVVRTLLLSSLTAAALSQPAGWSRAVAC